MVLYFFYFLWVDDIAYEQKKTVSLIVKRSAEQICWEIIELNQ